MEYNGIGVLLLCVFFLVNTCTIKLMINNKGKKIVIDEKSKGVVKIFVTSEVGGDGFRKFYPIKF